MDKFAGRIAAGVLAFALAGASPAQVVISQVYGGGGNNGAPLRNDFIELHNNGASAVDLSGWSVQYASAAGTSWQRTELSGSIAPGAYYLIQQAAGANADAPTLPTPDAVGTIPMAGSAGKVALVNSTAVLSGACPTGNVDFVGFGATATCAEGAAPTANLGNATAALRGDSGCIDTNNNGADLVAGTPLPRNGASPLHVCIASDLPVLSVGDAVVVEGNDGQATLHFPVTLSGTPDDNRQVTFDYATVDGTATVADGDYSAASGSLQLGGAGRQAVIAITVNGDTRYEPSEIVLLNLTNIAGAIAGDAQAEGSIDNDDLLALSAIHHIQGNGASSPMVGQMVSTEGVVTGRKNNGFFIQSTQPDADPTTSEGVFVFTGAAAPAVAAIGNRVRVTGTVFEFVPSADPGQAPLTEIGGSPVVALVAVANPDLPPWFSLPAPVQLTSTFPDPNGPLDQLERVEGMRVQITSATVVAPTQGSTNEPNATGSSNGVFNVVVAGVPRPFREPGIQAPDNPPDGGTAPPIPRWDFNPELLTVDSDALGGERWDVSFGAQIGNMIGPLDYGFRRYTLLPDQLLPTTILRSPEFAPRPAAASADPAAFTVAGYNLERFFDTTNDPSIGEPVLTAAAFERRLAKASLGIRKYLHAPDILGAIEVENLSTLQTLASRINADAVAAGDPDPRYVPYLLEGNDVGGIDVGFLVKTADVQAGVARVEVQSVAQIGKDTTWVEPNGSSSLLNDRPPLVLEAMIHDAQGRAFPLGVVLVHQRSLSGADANDADGDRIRHKRQYQAEFLAADLNRRQADTPGARLVVLGDFNAFEFNDGLVDAMNVVTGTPSADEATAVPGDGADLVEPNLVNLGGLTPAAERYSFLFGGNAQTLDHVLVNEELVVHTSSIALDHARINADFPEINRNDAASPSRLSDHDPVLATFVPRSHADLGVTATATSAATRVGEAIAFDATLANHGPEAADFPGIGFVLDGALPTMAVVAPAGWNCDAPQVDAGKTSVACTASTLADGAAATFVVTATATEAQVGATVALAVAADAQSFDPVASNDQASTSAEVFAVADLAVSLLGPGKHLRSGTVGSYLVTLGNAGADIAPQTRLTLSGDAPAANVAIDAPQGWTCDVTAAGAGFEASCSGATLAANTIRPFALAIVAPPREGDERLTVTAQVSAPVRDPHAHNNHASHSVRLIGRPH
ncbi:lamin tail domain-containing protein [Lysobacter cavernae]|uniref:Lamin tail domain-containing protein n=1 Tax=Lysobacter cavernae TaxID=1685901 RepID=A0ABV7RTW3_9GAMM